MKWQRLELKSKRMKNERKKKKKNNKIIIRQEIETNREHIYHIEYFSLTKNRFFRYSLSFTFICFGTTTHKHTLAHIISVLDENSRKKKERNSTQKYLKSRIISVTFSRFYQQFFLLFLLIISILYISVRTYCYATTKKTKCERRRELNDCRQKIRNKKNGKKKTYSAFFRIFSLFFIVCSFLCWRILKNLFNAILMIS